jgi:hypothetical protein
MNLADLKFDTPHNACTSLRILAEMVRREEIIARSPTVAFGGLCDAELMQLEFVKTVKAAIDLKARTA